MKKTLPALLLIAAMLFSLCACSGAPAQNAAPEAAKTEAQENKTDTPAAPETAGEAAAPAAEPTPEPEPEPEKLYRMEERELLIRKNVQGYTVSADIPTGRVFDAVTDYVYDEYGEQVSETTTYAHPSLRNSYYPDAEYSCDDAGRIVGETRTKKSQGLQETYTFAYDENGFCTHWSYDWETIGSAEADFSYDADGRLSFVSLRVNGEGEQTMTPVYENGVQVATRHVAPDGGEVEQFFRYDEQGRLCAVEYDAAERHLPGKLYIVDYPHGEFRYNPYKAGDRHIEILLHYGDDDLITEAEWKVDGKTVDRTRYSYTASKNKEGAIAFSVDSNSNGPFLWGGTLGSDPWDRAYLMKTSWGNPSLAKSSVMQVVGDRPQYVDSFVDWEYETRFVSVEVEPSDEERAAALEELYPALPDTLCGQPVPKPDGSKRLVRVEMPYYMVAAEPVYREDGSCAGVITRFDGQKECRRYFWYDDLRADEQGRITYNPSNQISYTWAEDGLSYVSKDRNGHEVTHRLEDYLIPQWLKPRQRMDWEYSEDGLPTKEVWLMGPGPDAEKRVTEYSYFWETNARNPRTQEEDCTALKSNNGQWDQDVMIFDSHGYLLEYNLSNTYLEYYYE